MGIDRLNEKMTAARIAMASEYIPMKEEYNELLADCLIAQMARMNVQADGMGSDMNPESLLPGDVDADEQAPLLYIPGEEDIKAAAQKMFDDTSGINKVIYLFIYFLIRT
jgi:hypothetical protein